MTPSVRQYCCEAAVSLKREIALTFYKELASIWLNAFDVSPLY